MSRKVGTPQEPKREYEEYRIDYSIMRRPPGEEDFTEYAFGSTPASRTIAEAAFDALGGMQNEEYDVV